MRDYTLIRNAFKFGVQTIHEGQTLKTLEGQEAYDAMQLSAWPAGTKWPDRIPTIPPKPKMFLSPGVDNPNFVAEYHEWKADLAIAKAEYLTAMRTDYPTLRFVLMAYNSRLGWFIVPDNNSDAQWLGFVNRTILWTDKEKIMKSMIRL